MPRVVGHRGPVTPVSALNGWFALRCWLCGRPDRRLIRLGRSHRTVRAYRPHLRHRRSRVAVLSYAQVRERGGHDLRLRRTHRRSHAHHLPLRRRPGTVHETRSHGQPKPDRAMRRRPPVCVVADNDPLNKIDPTGLRPPDDDIFQPVALMFPAGEICGKILWVGGCVGTPEPRDIIDAVLAFPAFSVEIMTTVSQFTTEQIGRLNALVARVVAGSPSPLADFEGAVLAVANDGLGARISDCAKSGGGRPVWCVSPAITVPPGETVAVTVGHFIFCEADKNCTNQDRVGFLDHEVVHVDQWEEFGDAFHLLYPIASVRAVAESFRTGERYDCVHAYEGPAYKVGPTDPGAPGGLIKCG